MRQVVDASALLAFLLGEDGGDALSRDEGPFCLSSVNLTEVQVRLIDCDLDPDDMTRVLRKMPIELRGFDADDARRSADLRRATRSRGLSLGDRACLALAQRLDLPVLTADRKWAELDIGLDIRLIR